MMRATNGTTFTAGDDGGGAYPGEACVNGGFEYAVEYIVDADSPEKMMDSFWTHPKHVQADARIRGLGLVEDGFRMDWLEERETLVVPGPHTSYVKHIEFVQFDEKRSADEQTMDLFAAWRNLPSQVPGILSASCGAPIRWEFGDTRGYHAALCADIALESPDGIPELQDLHSHPAIKAIEKELLAPMRTSSVVMDLAEHSGGSGSGGGGSPGVVNIGYTSSSS